MKFFGYENHRPSKEGIETEIKINLLLKGISGVAQLLGVFNDTEEGLRKLPLTRIHHPTPVTPHTLLVSPVSNIYREKKFHDPEYPYPVLVMEALLGDSLLYRMIMQRDLSEHYLVPLFRNFIQVVDSFHRRNLIHRDLKLDNIMLVSTEADSDVKLVDFGMMVQVPGSAEGVTQGILPGGEPGITSKSENGEGQRDAGIYRDRYLTGTPGYYAPESILRHEYSYQSDVWQCGVILFTILAGHLPFGSDNPKQIINNAKKDFLSELHSSAGSGPQSISPMAVDLIKRMLTSDPSQRITITEVLRHPWLNSAASSLVFGSSYQKKIKNLACYETLRRAFHENNVEKETKSIRDGMSHVSFRVESIEAQLLELKKKVIKNLFHLPPVATATTEIGTRTGARNGTRTEEVTGTEDSRPQLALSSLEPTVASPPPIPSASSQDSADGDNEEDEKEDIHPLSEADFSSPPIPSPSLSSPILAPPIFPEFTDETHSGNMNSVLTRLENASIDYETFSRLAIESQLDVLTIPELFSLFDVDKNGSIDLREFLLTILTLRSPQENLLPNSSGDGSSSVEMSDSTSSSRPLRGKDEPKPDPAKLYFDLFDLDGSGSLSRNEFLWMLSCLYHDGRLGMTRAPSLSSSPATAGTTTEVSPALLRLDTNTSSTSSRRGSEANPLSNRTIEELFQTLDLNHDNQIDYEEFQRFYQLMSLLSQPSAVPVTTANASSSATTVALEIPSHPRYNYLKQALAPTASSFTFSSTGSSQLYSTNPRSGVVHDSQQGPQEQEQGQDHEQQEKDQEDHRTCLIA
jgi:serine/threonine protein kinase/Ca2+-binding EF-hand superfamily protein